MIPIEDSIGKSAATLASLQTTANGNNAKLNNLIIGKSKVMPVNGSRRRHMDEDDDEADDGVNSDQSSLNEEPFGIKKTFC